MKRKKKDENSLFTPRLRGGVVGGSGYNFQDAHIVMSLPTWLRDPDFRSFIKEGFEDVDVRFENAQGAWTKHYQLKDHTVTVPEFREIVASFARADRGTEVNPTSFILGCCGLAPPIASLWKRILEFRGVQKSYPDGALVATKNELLTQIARLKLSDYADLLLTGLQIDYENPNLRDTEPWVLMERFRGVFITLPLYYGEDHAVLDRLFMGLLVRINRGIRVGITRDEIVTLIRSELASAAKGPATVVYLHGWARQEYDLPADFEIDWTPHFDHEALRVPPPEVWRHLLLPELRELRGRFDSEGSRRNIWLRGRAPLSAGLAFGHAFSEAAGYAIRVQQPSPGSRRPVQCWQTDVLVDWIERLEVSEMEGDPAAEDVVVAIGVTDDPKPKVERYLAQAGLRGRAFLYIYPTGGPSPTSIDETNVGAFAVSVKREIRLACDQHFPRLIHMFYFGPFGLAVLLGQKLNGLADIQCYERDRTKGYTPSCRLPA